MPGPTPLARALRLVVAVIATLLLPLTSALVAAPAHATPSSVSGVVVDGLGDPLGGVSVAALVAPDWSPATSTTTSTSGGYQLSLGSGTYRLRFDRPGHEQTFYGGGSGVDVVVDVTGELSVDGEPVEDNVLTDVVLPSNSTHQVTGTVLDTEGTALGAIIVEAFAPGDTTDPIAATTTSGSGAYTLEVRTGVYQVRYTDPSSLHLAQWYGGGEPEDVVVAAARTLDPVALGRPTARFPVAGTVVDALGDPVAGVSVSVVGTGATTDTGTDTTGPAGAYSVPVLPGTYRVQLVRTGFVPTSLGGQATPSTVTVTDDGTLSVAPAEVLVDGLLPAVVLRSTPYAVAGTVAAADGTPLSGITVRALPEGSTDAADAVDTTTSDAGGSYVLDLPVGAYDLDFVDDDGVRPAYATGSTTAVHVTQGGALTVDGTPVPSLPGKRLALSSADTPHAVVGSVVDLNGDPVDGLTVSAVPDGGGMAVTTTTGDDGSLGDHGRYRLVLRPGRYRVDLTGGPRWRDTSYTGAGTALALVEVQLNGTVLVNGVEAVGGDLGSSVVEDALGSGSVSGRVVDTDGRPVPGATVDVLRLADPVDVPAVATTTTSATGVWTVTGLPVGSYVLRISDGATSPVVRGPVTVRQDGAVSVEGVAVTDGETGDVVVPVPVVVPPVVVPPVVVPPVVVPPVVVPPVVVPPVVDPPVVGPPVVVPPVVQPPGTVDEHASRPGAPTIGTVRSGAKGGRSTATVRWGAPADDGGGAVTSYRVQVFRLSPSGAIVGRTVRLARASVRAAVLRLAPGSYRFRVSAVNEVGASSWSALSRKVVAR